MGNTHPELRSLERAFAVRVNAALARSAQVRDVPPPWVDTFWLRPERWAEESFWEQEERWTDVRVHQYVRVASGFCVVNDELDETVARWLFPDAALDDLLALSVHGARFDDDERPPGLTQKGWSKLRAERRRMGRTLSGLVPLTSWFGDLSTLLGDATTRARVLQVAAALPATSTPEPAPGEQVLVRLRSALPVSRCWRGQVVSTGPTLVLATASGERSFPVADLLETARLRD